VVSFYAVFDLVVKILGSILLAAAVLFAIGVAFVGWSVGPWWGALIWSLMTAGAVVACGCIMKAAQDERKQ
jgi:Sec-independent protein secretion pathway component TatC